MNPKITINLSECRCAKCREIGKTDRHHIRSQKMWVNKFSRTRVNETRYVNFVKRYESFNPRDIALLCRECHELIHEEYMFIILDHYNCNRFEYWTWPEAMELMKKFEKFFKKWVKE